MVIPWEMAAEAPPATKKRASADFGVGGSMTVWMRLGGGEERVSSPSDMEGVVICSSYSSLSVVSASSA